jgi:hypothetical protein
VRRAARFEGSRRARVGANGCFQQAADRRERIGLVGTARREGLTMTRLSKPTLLRAYTDFALVVAGTLQLFDDAPSGERKLASSFPSALRAVCRYIAAVEGPDRAEFVKRLLGMLEWVGPDSRKPRFQQLRDGNVHGIALLRRVHLDVTADEASAGITLLDKFGVLSWFTGGEDFSLVQDGSDEFQDRLGALQRLSGRWTYALVTRLLRELMFTGTPRELVDARKRPKAPADCNQFDRELNGAAHDIVPNVPTDKRPRTAE